MRTHGLFVGFLLGVALAARFYLFPTNPPSLNWDEASLGYNAYSIWTTGHDEWGKYFPVTFKAFGEYKLPGYIYADVIPVAIGGLNAFTVRLPSFLAGIGVIVLTYLIIYALIKNRYAALFGALLVTITPWHFFLSHIALEANLALFMVVLGVYLFILAYQGRMKLLPWSFTSFALSLLTYNSARVFTPLLVMALIFFAWRHLWQHKRIVLIASAIFFATFLVVIPISFQDSSARYQNVTVLDQGRINNINEARGRSSLPAPLKRLVYNKATFFVQTAAYNYAAYFSPVTLFVKGGSQHQFSIPGFGLLYWIELPLVLSGIVYLTVRREKYALLLAMWLLLAPIPAAITRETPHVLRAIFMLPTFEILSAIGAYGLFVAFSRKYRSAILVVGLTGIILTMWQAFSYMTVFTSQYPKQYSCSWQYGYKEMVTYVNNSRVNYDRILITKRYGEPQVFMNFFNRVNPLAYTNDPYLVRYERDNWNWVDHSLGIDYVNDWQLQQRLQLLVNRRVGRILVVTSPNNYPKNLVPFKEDYFVNGQPVFDYLSVNSNTQQISETDLRPVSPLKGCLYD